MKEPVLPRGPMPMFLPPIYPLSLLYGLSLSFFVVCNKSYLTEIRIRKETLWLKEPVFTLGHMHMFTSYITFVPVLRLFVDSDGVH